MPNSTGLVPLQNIPIEYHKLTILNLYFTSKFVETDSIIKRVLPKLNYNCHF